MARKRAPDLAAPPVFRLKASPSVRFSPDSRWLAVGGVAKVALWDARAGKTARVLGALPHEGGPAFSPDGALVAVKNPYGDLAVVAAATGEVVAKRRRQVREEGPPPVFVGDRAVADATWAGNLTLRSASDLTPLFEASFPDAACSAVAASPGMIVVLVTPRPPTGAAKLVTWRWRGRASAPRELAAPAVDKAWFAPDLRKVVLRHANERRLELRALRAGLPVLATRTLDPAPPGLTWHIFDGAFSPDGDLFAVSDMKSGLHLLDARTLAPRAVLPFPGACAADFSPDGELLAIGGATRGAVLRHAPTP